MFTCRACSLRLKQVLIDNAIIVGPRLALTKSRRHSPFRRCESSTAAVAPSPLSTSDGILPNTTSQPTGNKSGKIVIENERALRKELEYLKDPLKLAQHVHYTLRCAKPDKALNLCRLASRTMNAVVSWNHVINWHVQQRPPHFKEAFKIYNEMKKRAQWPDSYTYLLLLRGLGAQDERGSKTSGSNSGSAAKAVVLYNSMFSPTSKVQPGIIHTNAALTACSKAADMDGLWAVVSRIPRRGPTSADHITYTIILRALRQDAGANLDLVTAAEQAARKAQAVNEGRRIWREVVSRWREGELRPDESLVCAMARLLLTSERMEDWDDVLNLLQQTMKIERQIAPVGSPDRQVQHVPRSPVASEEGFSTTESEDDYEQDAQEDLTEDTNEHAPDLPSKKVFTPVQISAHSGRHRQHNLAYAQPGNGALSVLIETCLVMRTPKAANAYWDLLTEEYNVRPDQQNFKSLFRLLAHHRNSRRAADLVKTLPDMGFEVEPITFRLAMAVCQRNMKAPTVLSHARTIIDVMESTQANVDVTTLRQYLQLSLASENGPEIVAAIDTLDTCIHALRSRFNFGWEIKPNGETMSEDKRFKDAEEIVDFLQMTVGAIDTLMHRQLVPTEHLDHWHSRRRQLTHFIGKAKKRLENAESRQRSDISNVAEEGKKVMVKEAMDGRSTFWTAHRSLRSFRKGVPQFKPWHDFGKDGSQKSEWKVELADSAADLAGAGTSEVAAARAVSN